jgi:hypothetical protein
MGPPELEVALQAIATPVSPTFGAMTIEGPPRAAVLLNGKTPDFFVGHIDEFNHNWVVEAGACRSPGLLSNDDPGTRQGAMVGSRGSSSEPACSRLALRAALVSNPLIHFPRLEPSHLTRNTAARAPSNEHLAQIRVALPLGRSLCVIPSHDRKEERFQSPYLSVNHWQGQRKPRRLQRWRIEGGCVSS